MKTKIFTPAAAAMTSITKRTAAVATIKLSTMSAQTSALNVGDRMKSARDTFLYYKQMEKMNPESGMLREVMWQYQSMAAGGDGGPMGYHPSDYKEECGEEGPSCRDYNYPGYPDSFFQEVCALMNWSY